MKDTIMRLQIWFYDMNKTDKKSKVTRALETWKHQYPFVRNEELKKGGYLSRGEKFILLLL